MTVRQDVLDAARRLTTRGIDPFSPAQIVAEALSAGSVYAERSLRTHVVSYMCSNGTGEHSGRWHDLVRVGRGRYQLASTVGDGPATPPADTPANAPTTDPQADWYWEGNLQATVVRHLVRGGWDIVRFADTAAREHGIDIEARRNDERLAVEVKGFPSRHYVRGPKQGQPKPTSPTVQARHWFANALLSAMVLIGDDYERRTVIALPDASTYRSLSERTAYPRAASKIEVWLVTRGGEVEPLG